MFNLIYYKMAKFSFDDLKAAYEELIDVMTLTEKKGGKKVPVTVPKDADVPYLVEKIKEAKGWIEEGDKFSDETQEVLDNIDDFEEDGVDPDPKPEPEEKPVRGKKTPAAKEKEVKPAAEKKGPIKKAGGEGSLGIIGTIVKMIEDSGKKGVTKAEILAELKEQFPDRNEQSMKNTINVQVPARINKEKFTLKKLEGDRYAKA